MPTWKPSDEWETPRINPCRRQYEPSQSATPDRGHIVSPVSPSESHRKHSIAAPTGWLLWHGN